MIDIDKEREAFEQWITAPPFEMSITRYPLGDGRLWPGEYLDTTVELAWEVWQARAAMAKGEEARR